MKKLLALGHLVRVCLLSLAFEHSAFALPSVAVSVGPGAQSCPDAVGLAREAELAEGRVQWVPVSVGADFSVHFQKADGQRPEDQRPEGLPPTEPSTGAVDAFVAVIQSRAGGVRRIESDHPDCQELGRAVALTLLMLSEAESEPQPAPEKPISPGSPVLPIKAPPGEKPLLPKLSLSLAGSGAVGLTTVLGGIAVSEGLALGLSRPLDLSLSLEHATRDIAFAPGRVALGWFAGGIVSCPWGNTLGPFRVRGCGGVYVTRLTGVGRGYPIQRDEVVRWRPAWTVGLAASTQIWGNLRWNWGVTGGLIPSRERLVIAGLSDPVLETSPLFLQAWIGLGVELPIRTTHR